MDCWTTSRRAAALTPAFQALGFSFFDETRSGRILADGTPLGDEQQQGFVISAEWQFGAKMELTASGSFYNRETEATGKQDIISASLSTGYRLGSSFLLSVGYNYSEQDPDAGATGRDYVSNVVSLFLTYSF